MSDDHKVGYKKPPKHSQFKKGKSGNPRGRLKKQQGMLEQVMRALSKKLRITVDGKTQDVSAICGIVLAMIKEALKGDVRAASQVFNLCDRLKLLTPPPREGEYGVLLVPAAPASPEEWEANALEYYRKHPPPKPPEDD